MPSNQSAEQPEAPAPAAPVFEESVPLDAFYVKYLPRYGALLGGFVHEKEQAGQVAGPESVWLAELEQFARRPSR